MLSRFSLESYKINPMNENQLKMFYINIHISWDLKHCSHSKKNYIGITSRNTVFPVATYIIEMGICPPPLFPTSISKKKKYSSSTFLQKPVGKVYAHHTFMYLMSREQVIHSYSFSIFVIRLFCLLHTI